MNPIVQTNEAGINLIKAVCDSALKKDGLNALNAVSLLLANTKPLPPVAPPQKLPGTEPIKPKEKANIVPLKQPEKK